MQPSTLHNGYLGMLHLNVFYPNCKLILFPRFDVKWNMEVPTVCKKIF